jgi:hypothetical protein
MIDTGTSGLFASVRTVITTRSAQAFLRSHPDPMRRVAWLAFRALATLMADPMAIGAHSVSNARQLTSLRLTRPPQKKPRASVGLDCGAG